MKLCVPSKEEATRLLAEPAQFRGLLVCKGALPPSFILERALAAADGRWLMPRLFWDEAGDRIVGSGGFKSEPQAGKIQIGYGVAPACRGRGYATDGVTLLIEEAFSSGQVTAVLAETLLSNGASKRVLEKAGFIICGSGHDEEGPINRWAIKKASDPGT
jgi:[ribosomal protein S5]-alanine N-acetyltransferase